MSETAESQVKVFEIRVSADFTLPDDKVLASKGYDITYNQDVLLHGIALVSRRKELEHNLTVDTLTADILRSKEKQVQTLEEEISTLRRRLSDTFSNIYEDGRKAAMDEISRTIGEQEKVSKQLKEITDGVNYITRVYNRSGCAKEVGNKGERFVEVQLRSMLSSARVESSSTQTAEADIRLYYDSYTFLIEAKNKSFIDKKDITKFYRDIEANSSVIDAAIFVSLQDTNLVHGYSKTHLEMVHGIPVVYLSDVMETPRALEIAVRLLTKLLDSGAYNSNTKVAEDHMRSLALKCAQKLMTTFYNEQANLQKDKKLYQGLGQQIDAREKALLDFRSYQEELRSIFPNIDNLARMTVSTTSVVTVGPGDGKQSSSLKENIIKWLQNPKNRDSTMTEIVREFNLNGKWQISELGGIKHLKGMASIRLKTPTVSVGKDLDISDVSCESSSNTITSSLEEEDSDTNDNASAEIYNQSSEIDLKAESTSLGKIYGIDAED
jgi:hypothetical protein